MRFAPLFGRFCSIFLHLVQELAPNFGDFLNKFCNIFVTILPHLFRFGETSFYGGKKCRFSSFSGRGGGAPVREADAPGFGIQRFCLRGSCSFVQPLRHPFGMPPPLVGEARAFPPRSWLSLWESWLRSRLRGCMGGFSAREADASGFGIQRFCLRRSSCFVQPLRQRLWRCHLP